MVRSCVEFQALLWQESRAGLAGPNERGRNLGGTKVPARAEEIADVFCLIVL